MPEILEAASLKTKRSLTVCGLPALLLLGGAGVLYQRCGASAPAAVWAWAAAVLAVFVPGSALAARLCPDAPASLRPVLSVLFGAAGFSLTAVLASFAHLHSLLWVWTLAGCGVWLYQYRAGQHRPGRLRTAHGVLFLLCAVLICMNALWAVRYIHPSVVTVARPSQDFFWNLGNTQSLLQGFPLADLRVEDVTVSYHFLTELFGAGLCMLTGLPPYDVVAFYGYGPIAAALVLCLYGLGRTLWQEARVRPLLLAALPLWLGCASLWKVLADGLGRFGNVLELYVVSNINGQATALVALAGFFAVFAHLERTHWQASAGMWAAAGAAFYLLTFAKSPQAAILALALTGALVLRGLFALRTQQKPGRGLVGFFLLVPVGFWLVYALCFSAGADSSMAFSLTGTLNLYFFASILQALQIRLGSAWPVCLPVLWVAQSLLAAPAAFCVWAVSALRDVCHLRRVSALHLTWHACIVGGLAAFYWFDHYSSSQLYFLILALFCLGLMLLDRLPALWQGGRVWWKQAARAGCAALLAVGCGTSLCFAVWLAGTTPVQLAGGVPDARYYPLTAQEEEACAWLAENGEPDALFATNRMHTGTACEGLSNVYTGLSGQQAYCESFKYAVSNMGDRAGDVMARYETVCRIFAPETPAAEREALCRETGITYLVYHAPSGETDAPLAACFAQVWQSDVISIYKVA